MLAMRSVQRLRRTLGTGRPLTILEYHSVDPLPAPYAITPGTFERHLDLLQARYEIVRLRDVPNLLRAGIGARRVVLTFDDAYLDFVHHVLPALFSRGIPATLFVPTAYIGDVNRWDQGEAPVRKIMGISELRTALATGLIDIGSHTIDHVRMSALTEGGMRRQAEGSRGALERMLQAPVRTFAYPYGMLDDYSALTERVLLEAGYEVAVTSHWGTVNKPSHLLALRRIALHEGDSNEEIIEKVEGGYDWIAVKERVGYAMRATRLASRVGR